MKVVTILGTRPEIIRLSRVIPLLDRWCEHVLVHTGQNSQKCLKGVFFQELGIREPDYSFVSEGPFGEQAGNILANVEEILQKEKPDRCLILGDTNSGLAALVAKRMGIPVFHMEAGNRCYSEEVPEEVNRRVIDHVSDVLMPYTERARQNLIREGIEGERIYVTGNPIQEVLTHHGYDINQSSALTSLGLREGEYYLATLHRGERRLPHHAAAALLEALHAVGGQSGLRVIVSTHPRTRDRIRALCGVSDTPLLPCSSKRRFLDPLGFFDFVRLEQSARCVLTDSGTVQEECAILRVPVVTLRDVTERPETIECGSNILVGTDPESVARGVRHMEDRAMPGPPPEYLVPDVSQTVANIVLGFHRGRA